MIGMALATAIYAAPTWTRHAALVSEHPALRAAITCGTPVPSVYPCYRFTTKLRTYGDLLAACLDRVTTPLHAEHPDMGVNVAIDGSTCPTTSATCPRTGRSASAKAIPTRRGATGPPSRHARRRVLRVQDRRFRVHHQRAFPSRGTCARPASTRRRSRCR